MDEVRFDKHFLGNCRARQTRNFSTMVMLGVWGSVVGPIVQCFMLLLSYSPIDSDEWQGIQQS